MTREHIIEDARRINPYFEQYLDQYDSELAAACDTIALNGYHDDLLGDVNTFGLFYLIGRCILRVFDDNSVRVTEFASPHAAESEWQALEREYEDWCRVEELAP